jgi:uncharacterized protein
MSRSVLIVCIWALALLAGANGLRAEPNALEPTALNQMLSAARAQTQQQVIYDGRYQKISYPGGDVPQDRGVCTDVIIRAYRSIGIDLQQRVHEDMKHAFDQYPKLWGMRKPDTNIDHRRVPNLQTYFNRSGASVAVSRLASDYQAGDLVTWMLPGNLPHIGIVTAEKNRIGNPLIVHNIGRGPQLEDMLFNYPITGHYRFASQ